LGKRTAERPARSRIANCSPIGREHLCDAFDPIDSTCTVSGWPGANILDTRLGLPDDVRQPRVWGALMDVGNWLRSLGLERYEAAFRENEITENVLPNLTAEDMRELGVAALGHRRTLLDAIAVLRHAKAAKPASADGEVNLPAPSIHPKDAERRQVTVMFSDLVGSTAMSTRMDPEDLREVISTYQKCVKKTVERFGGFVAKYMGDGVLVYFGYPQAHEDDAERAVRAGLELVAAVGALKIHAPLQARVGIATGLVVVGDLIGSGASEEQAIAGETPNVAARLQGVAEPNNVVIAESTRKLVGNLFELEDLGTKELKGILRPLRAWVALGQSAVESRFEALRAVTAPMVGRDEEMELLMRRWAAAKLGEGSVALISGEPGIGKSRIAQTMRERLTLCYPCFHERNMPVRVDLKQRPDLVIPDDLSIPAFLDRRPCPPVELKEAA
jgi:class 3 adenylate cyclase